MVPVFSRTPSKPCSKTIVRMVLVAVVALPGSVAPGDWLGRQGGSWWLRPSMASRRPMAPIGGYQGATVVAPIAWDRQYWRSARNPDRLILAYGVLAGAPGSTAAMPSGLMLKAKKVNGSLPGFPHWWTRSNGS
jgi:hypothetical protein